MRRSPRPPPRERWYPLRSQGRYLREESVREHHDRLRAGGTSVQPIVHLSAAAQSHTPFDRLPQRLYFSKEHLHGKYIPVAKQSVRASRLAISRSIRSNASCSFLPKLASRVSCSLWRTVQMLRITELVSAKS